MNTVDPIDRLNKLVTFQTIGLPHRNRARLYVIAKIAGINHELRSSREIPMNDIIYILDKWFPDWRNPDGLPPEETRKKVRDIATKICQQLVVMLGTPEEWHAKIEAEESANRAKKEARRKSHNQRHTNRSERKVYG